MNECPYVNDDGHVSDRCPHCSLPAPESPTPETFEAWMDRRFSNWRKWGKGNGYPQGIGPDSAAAQMHRDTWNAAIKSCGAEYVRVCNERDAAERALHAERGKREEAERLIKHLAPTGRYNGLDIEQWYQRASAAEAVGEGLKGQLRNADYLITGLQAELGRARGDAERYRWLRNSNAKTTRYVVLDMLDGLSGPPLDAAIDNAHSRSEDGGGKG